MDTWIISESDDITARVRKSLQKLEIECPLSRIISVESVGQMAVHSSEISDVVFIATSSLTEIHLDVLRYLQTAIEAKAIVVAPVFDHATVLKAIRAGARDFINADGDLEEDIADLISRLQSDRVEGNSKGRLTTIVSCHVPGDASILAVNVSAVIAKHTGVCGLLDFQLRGGDLAMLLRLSPRHNVYDLTTQRESIDEAMFQQALTAHESGIRLLAGPPLFSDLRSIQPHVCQHILGLAQSSFPYVVVNAEDIFHAEQVRTLASSDHIVLTMRMDLVSLYRAQQFLAYMRRNHTLSGLLHFVAMNTGHSGELPIHSVKKVLGVSEIHCIPDDPLTTTMSINVGNPLILEAPKSKVSKAIFRFAETLFSLNDGPNHAAERTASKSRAAALALQVMPFCK